MAVTHWMDIYFKWQKIKTLRSLQVTFHGAQFEHDLSRCSPFTTKVKRNIANNCPYNFYVLPF